MNLVNYEDVIDIVFDNYYEDREDILDLLSALPKIDIVKCKDCKYGEIDDEDFPWQYCCGYHGDAWNDENDFCSHGEKER